MVGSSRREAAAGAPPSSWPPSFAMSFAASAPGSRNSGLERVVQVEREAVSAPHGDARCSASRRCPSGRPSNSSPVAQLRLERRARRRAAARAGARRRPIRASRGGAPRARSPSGATTRTRAAACARRVSGTFGGPGPSVAIAASGAAAPRRRRRRVGGGAAAPSSAPPSPPPTARPPTGGAATSARAQEGVEAREHVGGGAAPSTVGCAIPVRRVRKARGAAARC